MPQVLLHRPPKSRAVRSNNKLPSSSPPSARQPQSNNHGENLFSLALCGRWVGSVFQGLLENRKPHSLYDFFGEGVALRFVGQVNLRLPQIPGPAAAAVRSAPAQQELRPGRRRAAGENKGAVEGFLLSEPFRATAAHLLAMKGSGAGEEIAASPAWPPGMCTLIRVTPRGSFLPRVFPEGLRGGVAHQTRGRWVYVGGREGLGQSGALG